MTLSELLTACYDEARYTSSPTSAITTRITRFLNEGVRAVLSEPGLARLVDSDAPLAIASVASQARYVAPEAVAQIRGISERTNDYALEAMSLDRYRRLEPDPASVSGTPTHYVPFGRTAVAVQPSNASELFVKSTSASDTGTAYLEGITTGGYLRTASVTMTGTTAVSLSASITDWIEVTDFYLSANAVGTVTLHEDSGAGTELARITIGQKRPRYTGFYLWPTPAAVVSYLVDYRREIADLVNSTDEPPLPTDYHRILVDYALWRELTGQEADGRAIAAMTRYRHGLNRLKFATQTTVGEIPTLGRARRVGHSRIGAFYPADSWR